MPRYSYTASNSLGDRVEGSLEAPSSLVVVTQLRKNNLFPIDVNLQEEQVKRSLFKRKGAAGGVKKSRVKLKDLAVFTRQTAAMLEAGISIVDVLEDLSKQAPNKYFGSVLQSLKKDIREGNSLSQAMRIHPRVFSALYVSLVGAGEESGSITEVMGKLATDIENQMALISKVRQALSYPAIVAIFFVGVVSFVFLFLLPQFEEVFSDFGAELPAFTLAVLAVSRFLVSTLPLLLIGLVALGVFFFFFKKTPAGRDVIDKIKIRLPLFGPLMLKVSLARLAGSLATLISGGVTITNALNIVSGAAGNTIIEKAIRKVREGVVRGSLVGEEMKKHEIFPPLFVRMVSVGEDTGKMDEMLNRVAKFFRDEVDATLNIMASIIEPVLIICLGAVVGVVVLAIYLPIFNIAGAMN